MDKDQIIGSLGGLGLEGICAVAAACVALIGQEADSGAASLAFESAVRTHGAAGEDVQADLNAGGDAIYSTISDLDDVIFDFDEEAGED